MRDYKHLAKKKPRSKAEKLVYTFLAALSPLYGYHIYMIASTWVQSIIAYVQSEPFALFPIILITIAVLTLGGGMTWDFVQSHLNKKGKQHRGMATMQQ